MKKNISINISGIIFHIEEDAYEELKNYLDSINKYFASFEDNQEIIADIENRMAEIFLAKLHEDKQVITEEDVKALIATMGSIRDFQAVEEPEIDEPDDKQQEQETETREDDSKKLRRNLNRKIIGGVCSGIADYFKVDPLWIRLAFLLLLFGYGIIFLFYIILWIVLPGSDEPKEDNDIKKMYRDPEKKVIAGVSSGMAAYFAVDAAVIRLIFVLTIFLGGTGLIIYVILWIILPEAKSITDKVKMKGEPVTLSNIETNVKKNLKVEDQEEESIFVKILLFPFRLIALIIKTLGAIIAPIFVFLTDFIRIIIGLFLIFIGLVLVFSMVVSLGVVFGVFSAGIWSPEYFSWNDIGFPVELVSNSFPTFTALAALTTVLVPSIFIMLLGSSMIARKIVFSTSTGWTLFAMFIVSIIIVSVNVPGIVYRFKEDGEYSVTETYDVGNKTAILKLNEIGMEDYQVATLTLRGYDGNEYKLEKNFESQGSSRRNAIENAKMVTYNVDFQDSVLVFDSNIEFRGDAIFRGQRLESYLYIPYGSKFMMDEDLRHIMRNTIYVNGYRVSDMEDNVWSFTPEEGLTCLTCEENDNYNSTELDGEKYNRTMQFDGFQDLSIQGAYTVDIIKSNKYEILLKGSTPDLNQVRVRENGDQIRISWDRYGAYDKRSIRKKEIRMVIMMPYLHGLDLSGSSKVYIKGLKQRDLMMEVDGASYVKGNFNIDNLEIDASGAAEIELEGTGSELTADLRGASQLNAYDYEVKRATLQAKGAAGAKAFVTDEIIMDESLISNIKFRGGATVVNDPENN
ncbi:PspC domain-containing protein [Fulvivirga sp. M361]|uniref:PspC domain-containing protein n=1 Tax=Fulvivirga sp. M361 TaxID=2594266 RepID=UPI00117A6FEA|nr:PspC domain-containing protein [Fulvivirga sp. M361]TRX56023.1 PspC domain-containing protein [Fulvivirga sp. M361]